MNGISLVTRGMISGGMAASVSTPVVVSFVDGTRIEVEVGDIQVDATDLEIVVSVELER